jgi:LuxR family maltose regulon positive regulatory protein
MREPMPRPPAGSLLATKLFIPPPAPDQVARPRLLARLDEGMRQGRRLTLVVAPPGWGKTTLLSAWLDSLAGDLAGLAPAVAWVSLDPGDNDPLRFWTYVCSALSAAYPDLTGLLPLLQAPQPPPMESLLTALLNAVATPSAPPALLVLDDYHAIDAPAIHQALAFLIEHLPPHLHLVLAGRADPPLPLGRLRARGALTELRAADLGFTPAEAAAFLTATMGLRLAPDDLAALEARTEGWVAGLQLAALAMRDRADLRAFIAGFTGSNRFVVDYLAEEVFERQPPDVQNFLLDTAILDRLSAPLCASVVAGAGAPAEDVPAAQAVLERLERANLFLIALDDDRRWYRYHHLFADVLRARLRQTRPGTLPALYRRAAAWCAARAPDGGPELLTEAVGYAVAAGDLAYAADLVEAHALPALWTSGDAATVRRWFAMLPEPLIAGRVALCLISIQIAFIAGDMAGLELRVAQARRALAALPDPPAELESGVTGTEGWVAILHGDYARGLAQVQQALAATPGPALNRSLTLHALGEFYLRSGNHTGAAPLFAEVVEQSRAGGFIMLAISGLSGLIRCRIFDGRLEDAAAHCREGLALAAGQGAPGGVTVANLHWMLAMVAYEWNDLALAEPHARTAGEISRLGNYQWLRMAAALTLAQVPAARGDRAGATVALDESARIAAETHHPRTAAQIAAIRLLHDLAPGPDAAPPGLAAFRDALDQDLAGESDPVFAVEPQYYAPLRVLLQDPAQQATARDLLPRLLAFEEAAGRCSRVIALLALQAADLAGQGAAAPARAALERALTLAAPGGYVRAFLDAGAALAGVLRQVAGDPAHADYARRLLAHFAAPVPAPAVHSAPSPQPAAALVEPLTERELEVLRLVAAGASNRDIAAHLILSVGTVKKHTNNIFGKLGVQSRTQAIVKARALGLLT